ncbi:hypothetical protein [Ramlibacter alkalitolerans]|uniref:Uncharacterized protein n=1 Tax=Ramlibacter alkalitolerans TaxID=2039631 RepID=A0ABS1JUG7_9BURK|nr:hypothetical protein [Ramlibacter alkalitolerans]MBL0427867.1 hypothetical protein [Ramlibacter alkalitolerans]
MDELLYLQEAIETGIGRELRAQGMDVRTEYTDQPRPRLAVRVEAHGLCSAVLHKVFAQSAIYPDMADVQQWWHPRIPGLPEDHLQNLFLAAAPWRAAEGGGSLTALLGLSSQDFAHACVVWGGMPTSVVPDDERTLMNDTAGRCFTGFLADPRAQELLLDAVVELHEVHVQLALADPAQWKLNAFNTGGRKDGYVEASFTPAGRTLPVMNVRIGLDGRLQRGEVLGVPKVDFEKCIKAGGDKLGFVLGHALKQTKAIAKAQARSKEDRGR